MGFILFLIFVRVSRSLGWSYIPSNEDIAIGSRFVTVLLTICAALFVFPATGILVGVVIGAVVESVKRRPN